MPTERSSGARRAPLAARGSLIVSVSTLLVLAGGTDPAAATGPGAPGIVVPAPPPLVARGSVQPPSTSRTTSTDTSTSADTSSSGTPTTADTSTTATPTTVPRVPNDPAGTASDDGEIVPAVVIVLVGLLGLLLVAALVRRRRRRRRPARAPSVGVRWIRDQGRQSIHESARPAIALVGHFTPGVATARLVERDRTTGPDRGRPRTEPPRGPEPPEETEP